MSLSNGQLIYQADGADLYRDRFNRYGYIADVVAYELVQNLAAKPIFSDISQLNLTDRRPDETVVDGNVVDSLSQSPTIIRVLN
jgi:hypothetical protein